MGTTFDTKAPKTKHHGAVVTKILEEALNEPSSPEAELGEPDFEQEDTSSAITEPYDPAKIRIRRDNPTVYNLIKRIRHGELDLTPSFQRHLDLWSDRNQSRLIESILMRIPLPAFYFDGTNRDRWLIVDGLQRLTALSRFVLSEEELGKLRAKLKPLELRELEFLTDLEGKRFDHLPRRYQREIEETQITAYLIEEGTPPEVKFNVFKRINTGGLPLSAQEIRHALNQGKAAGLLEELAGKKAFRTAVGKGISGKRMADRECVLRFLAFKMKSPEDYPANQDFDFFLSQQMAKLNELDAEKRASLARHFERAMEAAAKIFGEDAFRKRYRKEAPRNPINKALFEAWSVNLDRLDDENVEKLAQKGEELRTRFIELCNMREFDLAISQGTGDIARVKLRFARIRQIIEETLSQ